MADPTTASLRKQTFELLDTTGADLKGVLYLAESLQITRTQVAKHLKMPVTAVIVLCDEWSVNLRG